MESVGFKFQQGTFLETLTQDVVKTSEIEGELLDQTKVRSSVAKHLGIDIGAVPPSDRNVDGIVKMILDATQNYDQSLTKERLFFWHSIISQRRIYQNQGRGMASEWYASCFRAIRSRGCAL